MESIGKLLLKNLFIFTLLICIKVSDQCRCLAGYHCCDEETETCCPEGFLCTGGEVCINIIAIVLPVVFFIIVIIATVVVCIVCIKKKGANGAVIRPSGLTSIHHTSYGIPLQQMPNMNMYASNMNYQPPPPPPPQGPQIYDSGPPGEPQLPPAYAPMTTGLNPAYPPTVK